MKKIVLLLSFCIFSLMLVSCSGGSNELLVNYESNGGNDIEPSLFVEEDGFSFPQDPIKFGYVFDGWYFDEDLVNIANYTTIEDYWESEEITLYAKWLLIDYSVNYIEVNEYIENIKSFSNTSMGLSSQNRLYIWGNITILNEYDSDVYDENSAIPIDVTPIFLFEDNEIIIDYFIGHQYMLVVTNLGSVYSWGSNNSGNLGDGTLDDKISPVEITDNFTLNANDKIINVVCSDFTVFALSEFGEVFGWGANDNGYIGDGTFDRQLLPVNITEKFALQSEEKINKIYSNRNHNYVITNENNIYSWGINSIGELSTGDNEDKLIPVNVTDNFDLDANETIIDISIGMVPMFLSSEGRVMTVGFNAYGNLGDSSIGSTNIPVDITDNIDLDSGEKVKSITSGAYIQMVLTDRNRVFVWGRNQSGLIDYTSNDIFFEEPIDITETFELAEAEKIEYVHTGPSSCAYIRTNLGNIYSWGEDDEGLLADGETSYYHTPVEMSVNMLDDDEYAVSALPGSPNMMLTNKGNLYVWGYIYDFNLADLNRNLQILPINIVEYFDLNDEEIITSIWINAGYKFALTSEGRLFTWGSDPYKTNGLGNNIRSNGIFEITGYIGEYEGEYITHISSNTYSTLAITSENRVLSWGSNEVGQLGTGNFDTVYRPEDITDNFNLNTGDYIVYLELFSNIAIAKSLNGSWYIWGYKANSYYTDEFGLNQNTPLLMNEFLQTEIGQNALRIFPYDNADLFILGEDMHIYTDSLLFFASGPEEGFHDITDYIGLLQNETIETISKVSNIICVETTFNRTLFGGRYLYDMVDDYILSSPLIDMNALMNLEQNEHLVYYNSFYFITSLNRVFGVGDNRLNRLLFIEDYDIKLSNLSFGQILYSEADNVSYQDINNYVPVKAGYIFGGWYVDLQLTIPYEYSENLDLDLVLFAKWIKT